jgi:DNA-binding NarL/FixJ family response regulator
MAIKLAIGCHSYLFSEGLRRLLEGEDEINVVRVFNDVTELKEVTKLRPDIILAEFNTFLDFPDDFANNTQVRVLLISDKTWDAVRSDQILELITKGVSGFLPPKTNSSLLKKAIKAVYLGDLWIDRETIKGILFSRTLLDEKVNLTRKEKEVVSYICKGYRNKEIAQKLSISEQTVKSHCNRIYKKLSVTDRLQLAIGHIKKIWPNNV